MHKLFTSVWKVFRTIIDEIGVFLFEHGNILNTIVWIFLLLILLNGGCSFHVSISSTPSIDNVG